VSSHVLQYRSEVAMQAMQELVSRMTDKCFAKCTTKSGNKLDSKVTSHNHTQAMQRLVAPLSVCRLLDSAVGGRDSSTYIWDLMSVRCGGMCCFLVPLRPRLVLVVWVVKAWGTTPHTDSGEACMCLCLLCVQEQNCLACCMDRYVETMNIVGATLSQRQDR
jgi:hypothetical protein